jgi:hypothetical protein
VRFNETQMFYATGNNSSTITYDEFQVIAYPMEVSHEFVSRPELLNSLDSSQHLETKNNATPHRLISNQIRSLDQLQFNSEHISSNQQEPDVAGQAETEIAPLRRTSRTTKPSVKLQDFVTYITTPYPIENHVRCEKLSESFCSFLAKIEKGFEPKNFEEAKLNDSWATVMDEELNALKRNQT